MPIWTKKDRKGILQMLLGSEAQLWPQAHLHLTCMASPAWLHLLVLYSRPHLHSFSCIPHLHNLTCVHLYTLPILTCTPHLHMPLTLTCIHLHTSPALICTPNLHSIARLTCRPQLRGLLIYWAVQSQRVPLTWALWGYYGLTMNQILAFMLKIIFRFILISELSGGTEMCGSTKVGLPTPGKSVVDTFVFLPAVVSTEDCISSLECRCGLYVTRAPLEDGDQYVTTKQQTPVSLLMSRLQYGEVAVASEVGTILQTITFPHQCSPAAVKSGETRRSRACSLSARASALVMILECSLGTSTPATPPSSCPFCPVPWPLRAPAGLSQGTLAYAWDTRPLNLPQPMGHKECRQLEPNRCTSPPKSTHILGRAQLAIGLFRHRFHKDHKTYNHVLWISLVLHRILTEDHCTCTCTHSHEHRPGCGLLLGGPETQPWCVNLLGWDVLPGVSSRPRRHLLQVNSSILYTH